MTNAVGAKMLCVCLCVCARVCVCLCVSVSVSLCLSVCNVSTVLASGRSGIPVFEILLVRGIMILSISYMKAVTTTQHTFPYALGQR